MKVYVVRGRHGELHVTGDDETAFNLWARSNGFDNYPEFLQEYGDECEFYENSWMLDEGGRVDRVVLE